jgi:hypothetical protein
LATPTTIKPRRGVRFDSALTISCIFPQSQHHQVNTRNRIRFPKAAINARALPKLVPIGVGAFTLVIKAIRLDGRGLLNASFSHGGG